MCLEVLESIMYHAGSWLGSCDTFRPRSLSTFIVWAMVKSWLLLDLASLPKAESRPLEILLLPSALTLLSDIVSVPWDTDMWRSWALGQNRISQVLGPDSAPGENLGHLRTDLVARRPRG